MSQPAVHKVQIYYEDTDLSGVVYHANYLKYFERAREHMLGPAELVRLWDEDGIGFVVYHAELTYREGARLGDTLEIRTRVNLESRYRAIFHHDVYREGGTQALVEGIVHLVCVDSAQNLTPLPQAALQAAQSSPLPKK
jgi:tol-pal system-associated acyl-CoA thioesterase